MNDTPHFFFAKEWFPPTVNRSSSTATDQGRLDWFFPSEKVTKPHWTMFQLVFSRAQEVLSAKRHGFIAGVFSNFYYFKKNWSGKGAAKFLSCWQGVSALFPSFLSIFGLWIYPDGDGGGLVVTVWRIISLIFFVFAFGVKTCGQLFPIVWCVLRSLCRVIHLWPTPAPYLARPVTIFSFESFLSVWGQRDGSFFDYAVFISKCLPIYGQWPVTTVPAYIVLTLLVALYSFITDLNYIAGIWAHKWK